MKPRINLWIYLVSLDDVDHMINIDHALMWCPAGGYRHHSRDLHEGGASVGTGASNCGGDAHLPLRRILRLVMGTARLAHPQRDLLLRHPIRRPEHDRVDQPLLHLPHRAVLPVHAV